MDGHGGEGAGGSANGGSTNGGSANGGSANGGGGGDSLARKHSWALPLPRPNRPGVRVLVWGRNDLGQLGLGAATAAAAGGGGGGEGAAPAPPAAVYVPTPVEALSGRNVVELGGGAFHSAFVTGDGELFTCGCNDNSQLGRRVGEGGSSSIESSSSGGGGGGSSSGGVGDGRPGAVRALEAHTVAAAGCGASHSMALTEQGGVLAWGGNEFGQTGIGTEGPDLAHPRPVRGVGAGEHHRVVRLAVGANHALLLTGGGGVLAVGQGSFGALGLGPEALENRPVPLPVAPLAALGVVQNMAGCGCAG